MGKPIEFATVDKDVVTNYDAYDAYNERKMLIRSSESQSLT